METENDEDDEINENDNYPEHFRQLILKNKGKPSKPNNKSDLDKPAATTEKIKHHTTPKYFADSVEISSIDNLDRIKIQDIKSSSPKTSERVEVKTSVSTGKTTTRFRPKFPQSTRKFMSKEKTSKELSDSSSEVADAIGIDSAKVYSKEVVDDKTVDKDGAKTRTSFGKTKSGGDKVVFPSLRNSLGSRNRHTTTTAKPVTEIVTSVIAEQIESARKIII